MHRPQWATLLEGRRRGDRSRMVGRERPAPPRRWTSAHMRRSQERACRERQRVSRRRRVRRERARRACRRLAQAEVSGQGAHRREEPASVRCPRPATQARPTQRRRRPDDRPRAHPRPHLCRRKIVETPQRERQGDRARRVQPPPQDPSRHDEQHGLAGDAPVPPAHDLAHYRWRRRVGRAPLVAAPETVAVQHDPPAGRPARHAAREATRRPHLVRRRQTCGPGLDAELRVDDSSTALASHQCWAGARRGACSNTPPSPCFWGPAPCQCPASRHRPTITLRDRQFAAYAVGTAALLGASPSTSLRDIGPERLNRRAR